MNCKCVPCKHKKLGISCPPFEEAMYSQKLLKECYNISVGDGGIHVVCVSCTMKANLETLNNLFKR